MVPGPGQTPMNGQQQGQLAQALASVSPPKNSKVPFARTDPQHSWMIGLQRVRQSLRDLQDHLDDKEDVVGDMVSAMSVIVERMLAGVPPNEVALLGAATMLKGIAPPLAQQVEQQWATINRPPQVPGVPVPTGPPMGGPGAMQPGNPAINPGIVSAMMGQNGQVPGPGSPPPPMG